MGKVYGRKIFRTNLVADLANGKIVAEKLYRENISCSLFEKWLKKELLPKIKKKSVIVLDKATFHRKAILREIAKKRKCIILLLLPYSLGLNPIEKSCKHKKILKDYAHKFNSLQDAFIHYLKTV